MRAAVVYAYDKPPRYDEFGEPPLQTGYVQVTMHAAALSQLVRAQAAGTHYASPRLPFVPGVDGVGVLDDGRRVYFAFPDPTGSMAERVCVKEAYCVALPDDVDDVTAAAIANPGMSSWAALTARARLVQGESVLIHGAASASGRLAIRIAKHLGARRVVATARNPAVEAELRALGADAFVLLGQHPEALVAAFRRELADVDVVLDYLWGASAESIFQAALGNATGVAARRIRFVQLGSLSGESASLPAAALRSSGLELYGSGLGSLSNLALIGAIAELMQAVVPAGLRIATCTAPLSEVETAWLEPSDARLVFTL